MTREPDDNATNPAPVFSARARLLLGLAGIFGATLGVVSDNLLMVADVPVDVVDTWGFFKALMQRVPHDRLLLGHHLGLYSIPLSLLGFWQIWDATRGAGARWSTPVLVLSHALLVIGVAYHVQLAYIGRGLAAAEQLKHIPEAAAHLARMNAEQELYLLPTQHVITALLLLVSVGIGGAVMTGRTEYPRWFAGMAPLVLILIMYGAAQAINGLFGVRLCVSAMNLASIVVFSTSTTLLWRRDRDAAA